MHIKDGRSLDEDKELKVRIPIEHHVRLHTLKVLTGKPISTAVQEALDLHFTELAEAAPAEDATGDTEPTTGARGDA